MHDGWAVSLGIGVLAGVLAGLTACLLGLIARREFGPGIALPGMWLVTPMLLFRRKSR